MSLRNPGWLQGISRSGRIGSATDAYEVVPMLYRAVNLRCDAISTVPYTLRRRGEVVDWPWAQSVPELIKATERSLLLTGGAYWYKVVKGRTMTGFVVLNPTAMTVNFEPSAATLESPYSGARFTQTQLGRMYGPWTINEIVYYREPSYRDDILPGLAPARVALQSAQLGHYLERFISAFFEGGAQPVMVMNLPEAMDDAEFARFRSDFAARVGGVANAFRSLFVRSPELKVQKITPDINTMMLPELQERVITSIAMTLGVPRTMLEASAANYATADSDRQSFWRETIVPRLGLFEQVMNAQLLKPIGYEITFDPEMLDVLQADEANRADSLLKLTQAGLDLPNAMRILGYDGVDDMFLTPAVEAPPSELPTAAPDVVTDEVGVDLPPAQPDTATRSADYGLLTKKLERRIKLGKAAKCAFDSVAIPADEVEAIMTHMHSGITVAQMHAIVAAHEAGDCGCATKAVDDLTADERRIYDRIVTPMQKRGEAWARQVIDGETPDPSMSDIMAPVLNEELGAVMQVRIDRLGTQFAYPMETGGEVTLDWLADYVPRLNVELNDSSMRIVKKVIEQYRLTPGMTIQDVARALRPAVGASRAQSIAITEVTRAASQATIEYQTYLSTQGVAMERIWNTDVDEKVCVICEPLNRTGEDDWIMKYPSGPPAHSRCRCDTTLRLVKE